MPRAAGCEHTAKCSRIDSARMEVRETGWKGVDDGQCNQNEEEQGSEEIVEQNASLFQQLLYVSWPRVLVGDI